MKSLLLACLFFGVLVWGCYDVIPFKPLRRIVRRTPRAAEAGPPPEAHVPAAPLRARRR